MLLKKKTFNIVTTATLKHETNPVPKEQQKQWEFEAEEEEEISPTSPPSFSNSCAPGKKNEMQEERKEI